MEILVKGADALVATYGEYWGHWINTGSFFGGILLIGLVDNFIPASENPHEIHDETETAPLRHSSASSHDFNGVSKSSLDERPNKKLMRMGLFTALAIAIHNFPEGLANLPSIA